MEKMPKAKPWHIIFKKTDDVSFDVYQERMSICSSCPELIKLTKQCRKCGCFMEAKTKLGNAECPLGKWGQVKV